MRTGFTLIEVLIYTALLGLMISTTLTLFFPLTQSLQTQDTKLSETLESLFIAEKITWLMSQKNAVVLPLQNATSATLTVTTPDLETHRVRLLNHTLELSLDSDPFLPLTREHTSVDYFVASHTAASTEHAEEVSVTFSINGHPYGPLYYENVP